MSHFHRRPIVVPVDFSDSSLHSARVARSIAEDDRDVTLVYVTAGMDAITTPYGWAAPETAPVTLERCQQKLQTWIKAHDLGGVNYVARMGNAGMEVCDLAREMNSTLIVVASHGRSGLERVLLGSVAERIIRHCHCSVLVLRRGQDHRADLSATGSWCPRKRVVVPIDFSASTDDTLQVAKELVDGREQIDVINVMPHVEDVLIGDTILDEQTRRENRQESLERYLAEHDFDGMRAHAVTGDPGTTICQYASQVDADTVVIASHGYHGLHRLVLGSTAERVVRQSSAPVLVLRRHDAE
ncbi:MAG: universal stress protein [Planctomycetaceae bacterium]|nr:universal stress protein [Planctomycetaceae bacterium]